MHLASSYLLILGILSNRERTYLNSQRTSYLKRLPNCLLHCRDVLVR
jgi:hypothetical protein